MKRSLWQEFLLCLWIAFQLQPALAQDIVPGLSSKQIKYLKSLKMGYFAPTYLPPQYKAKTLEPENDGSQNEWYHITYSNGSDSCFALNASDGGYGAGDDDKIAYKSISSNNLGVNFTLDYLKKSKNQWGSMLPDRCFYPPESIANKNSEVSTCVDITQSRADIECKKTISRSEAIKVLKSLRYFRGAVKLRACDRTGDNQLSCLP